MAQNKPVIGVIACERVVEGEPAQAVKHRYLEAVERYAEAHVFIIPSNQAYENAAGLVERLDALVLTGSNSNIEPSRYGSGDAPRAPNDPGRDGFGAALIHAAIGLGKPLFGICRGLQEINVALGGSLHDMRGTPMAHAHHARDDADLGATFAHSHEIEVAAGSILQRYAGSTRLVVNSVHYQAIARLGEGLVANATGPGGVIEAISVNGTAEPVFAVQWHPEWQPEGRLHDLAFWHYLGEAARAHYVPAAARRTNA